MVQSDAGASQWQRRVCTRAGPGGRAVAGSVTVAVAAAAVRARRTDAGWQRRCEARLQQWPRCV